jgi:hypothetical protein
LTQLQSDEKHNPVINKIGTKSFANFWIGIFFMTSSVSLILVISMFIFIWQPIWTEGFKDFHTISKAIDNLNKTAKPASDAVPLMLVEMNKMNLHMHEMNKNLYEMHEMNKTMQEMQNTIRDMSVSIGNIEEMTPNIKRMTLSIEQMTMVLSTELPRISFLMGRVDNKMPNMDFMPFN